MIVSMMIYLDFSNVVMYFSVARIGFEFTALGVIEGSSATLSIAVLGDTALGRNVIVRFSTADITAIGRSLMWFT